MIQKIQQVFTDFLLQKKYNEQIESISQIVSKVETDFGGGCAVEKGKFLALIIMVFEYRSSLEIGVYRGRSLLPQLIAMKKNKGVVTGIDPYSNLEAKQVDRDDLQDKLESFATTTNFESIFQNLQKLIGKNGFQEYVKLIRQTSKVALSGLAEAKSKFDLIHIDGNHDFAVVSEDIKTAKKLLGEKGLIVLDDYSWPGINEAAKLFLSDFQRLIKIEDQQNDFAVFSNDWSNKDIRKIKSIATFCFS